MDVVNVRKKYLEFVDRRIGNDFVFFFDGLCVSVIIRKEFKYKLYYLEVKDNFYIVVLRGYRFRKRDEVIVFVNERDFMVSVMNESVKFSERRLKVT